MNLANVFVHRVASVEEVRALESIGVRTLGVSLLQNPELADGRELTVPEAALVLTAVRHAKVFVECDPEQTFGLPLALQRGAFLWSGFKATPRLLNRAVDAGYHVAIGPVAVNRFFDLDAGPPVVPGLAWEYQIRGGEPGALGDTLTKPGIFNKLREVSGELDIFVGFDVGPKTVGVARIALGPAAHLFALGHPRVPPAGRHHQSLGYLFDTLAELGYPAIPDAELSRLEAADIARRARGRLQHAKLAAHAAGKEPFSLQRFAEIYDLSFDNTAALSWDDQVARWEERYYVQAKHAMSLAEFARIYREMEAYR